jgi:hypothetical protein
VQINNFSFLVLTPFNFLTPFSVTPLPAPLPSKMGILIRFMLSGFPMVKNSQPNLKFGHGNIVIYPGGNQGGV